MQRRVLTEHATGPAKVIVLTDRPIKLLDVSSFQLLRNHSVFAARKVATILTNLITLIEGFG